VQLLLINRPPTVHTVVKDVSPPRRRLVQNSDDARIASKLLQVRAAAILRELMPAMSVMTSSVESSTLHGSQEKLLQARAAAILRKLVAAMSVMTSSVESLTLHGSQESYCKFVLLPFCAS
jgi:hypothetical protein